MLIGYTIYLSKGSKKDKSHKKKGQLRSADPLEFKKIDHISMNQTICNSYANVLQYIYLNLVVLFHKKDRPSLTDLYTKKEK